MLKRGVALLFFLSVILAAQAQTNFSQWQKFQSPRYHFQMNYPENWVMQEEANGQFHFYGEVTMLGEFFVNVHESTDSIAAINHFETLKTSAKGSSVDSFAGRVMLMYKIIKINNKEQEIEVHNWVTAYGSRVYHCRYEFPAKLRDTPNIMTEMQFAYRMIESLTFID